VIDRSASGALRTLRNALVFLVAGTLGAHVVSAILLPLIPLGLTALAVVLTIEFVMHSR
jgi:hypothetical protein